MTLGQIERRLDEIARNKDMPLEKKVNELEDILGSAVHWIKVLAEQIVEVGKLHNEIAEAFQAIFE